MLKRSFWQRLVTAFLLVAFICQGTLVLAGTTGTIGGTLIETASKAPISGAKITVTSPTQTASTTTDANGRFSFISLAPDTYTVSAELKGYDAVSRDGVTVFADQNQILSLNTAKSLAVIGQVRTRAASDLVRPGQTADVYSVGAAQTQAAQALGGGGNLGQTYAALASVPGVYIPQGASVGQNFAAPYIRGGDYNQVGYEFDGIPVNRAFDNYVTNTQGVTAQSELQVYTGGIPASSAGQGLSGYINQVIKTGTYPGTAKAEAVIGGPSFYHNLNVEVGGATPSRNFSYYLATTGWSQDYRVGNQFNGEGLNPLFLSVVSQNDDGTVVGGPGNVGGTANIYTRESIANFHFGIPHKKDAGKDDIQLLYSVGSQKSTSYNSINDYGGPNSPGIQWGINGNPNGPTTTTDPATYFDTHVYNGPLLSKFDPANVALYYYPSAPPHAFNAGVIDPNLRGSFQNDNGIVKVQYQKNLGSNAYVRLYGYSNYSRWFIYDPAGALYENITPEGTIDYELSSWTRGLNLSFADQINANHLLQGSAEYTFANVVRANNSTAAGSGPRIQLRDPATGYCYDQTGALSTCYKSVTGLTDANTFTTSTVPTVVPAGVPAGTDYLVSASGYSATLNTVQPKFSAFSLSDQWRASDKLKFDLGLRLDHFIYSLADTSQAAIVGGNEAALFNDYNAEHCYDPATDSVSSTTVVPGTACPGTLIHTNLSNTYAGNVSSTVLQPRIGGTFTVNPDTVIRASAGKYASPINSAYVQYNRAGDLASFTANTFFAYGFNTPRHDARPQISNNYDVSFERHIKGTPVTFSLTPFLRNTKDESQSFFIDPKQNFVSGLNVGKNRSYGLEFLARYRDFANDGLSGQVSFTYTNSKTKYDNFSGTTRNVIDTINDYIVGNATKGIVGYNQLTQAGGGSPCYAQADGSPALLAGTTCAAGYNPNPYYNQPIQSVLDRNGSYSPYDVFPGVNPGSLAAVGSSASYEIPWVTTIVAQYKKHGWRFIPTVQIDSGVKYGTPFAWAGYDPSSGCDAINNPVGCGTIFRPNPYTGSFDKLGQFQSPTDLTFSAQIAKDISPKATLTLIAANIYHACYSHGKPWENAGKQACGYFQNTGFSGGGAYLGNALNPGVTYQAVQSDPYGYAPGTVGLPLNLYLSLQVKL